MLEENFKERIIIVCPNPDCGQKMRIPKTIRTLQVTCPKCGMSFKYPAEGAHKEKVQWLRNRAKRHPIFLGLTVTLWILLISNKYLTGTLTLNSGFFITVGCLILWFFGTWIMEIVKEEGTKWYYKKWFVVLMLYLFTPIGITLLWAGSKFRKYAKIGLTIAFGVWFAMGILTQTPNRFYYSPKDELSKLISSHKGNIFLRSASRYAKTKFRNEVLGTRYFPITTIYTIPQIVNRWGKSVVLVNAMDKNGNKLSQGSGFIISRKGTIVTNFHVLESAYDASVEFINGELYQEVFLMEGYPSKDIAILHIEAKEDFAPVILGNSDDLEVGEQILAIGNPYGWENTVSDGLISGKREIDGFNLLQITVPISPGSSGGPVFNMKGEVVGITTIASQWGAQNLNFAIPINTLKSLIKKNFSP